MWQLETTRVWLRPWDAGDDVRFRRLTQNPRVMRYISNGQPWSDDQTSNFVERQCDGFAERGFCLWKLALRETGDLAGMCGLQPLVETPDIEIGWWLAPELWGRGIATEAARCALRFGFERAGLEQIVSVAQPANRASTRIMEKLGMKFAENVQHKGFEVARYVISKAEFSSQQGQP